MDIDNMRARLSPERQRQTLMAHYVRTVRDDELQPRATNQTLLEIRVPESFAALAPTMAQVRTRDYDQQKLDDASERMTYWLGGFFNRRDIAIESFGHCAGVNKHDGSAVAIPTARVRLTGEAHQRFASMQQGSAKGLPNLGALVDQVAHDDETGRFIAQRAEKVSRVGGDSTRVAFSIPNGTATRFCDTLRQRYGNVTFTVPTTRNTMPQSAFAEGVKQSDSPVLMVHVGATFSGAAARDFLADYQLLKK